MDKLSKELISDIYSALQASRPSYTRTDILKFICRHRDIIITWSQLDDFQIKQNLGTLVVDSEFQEILANDWSVSTPNGIKNLLIESRNKD